ncbi:MAG: prepilin-type N-terminal cleavage/methylation domain-containing protein [Terriglobia bacterium]
MARHNEGFSLIELLIVVAIILIIAAIAIPNLLRSRIAANQASAVESCRGISSSELTYVIMYSAGYAASLSALGPPAGGSQPGPSAADLIDSVVASGNKSGYAFVYTAGTQDSQGHYQSYQVNANPIDAGVTGELHYYTDQSNVIRANLTTAASLSDSPIGQ